MNMKPPRILSVVLFWLLHINPPITALSHSMFTRTHDTMSTASELCLVVHRSLTRLRLDWIRRVSLAVIVTTIESIYEDRRTNVCTCDKSGACAYFLLLLLF